MGQVDLGGGVKSSLRQILPVDVVDLAEGMQRYGMFTTDRGRPLQMI